MNYNKNSCAWLLWHWSSQGQLALCNPRGRSKFNWTSEDRCQRSHSKWVFVFIPHLQYKYIHLILSKLSRKSPICHRRLPWLRIVLVRSLRSALLDTAWLVKSVTYFDLIGGSVRGFQHSKYKFTSHPKTLECIRKCGVNACHTVSACIRLAMMFLSTDFPFEKRIEPVIMDLLHIKFTY